MSTEEEISLKLFHYLSKIIGSDDVVKTRQNIFQVMDFVMNDNDGFTLISSGSKAKGIDFKGSDFDRMIVLKMAHVNENMRDATYPAYGVFLLMEYTDTPFGFTKLKLYKNSQKRIPLIDQCSQTLGQETYISSKLFREYFVSPDMIIHGPCQSLPGDVYDRVVCFRCKTWIASAQPWINRSQSTWPGYKQVTSIVKYGVLVVPIGYKNSLNEDLEWRISFSMAEKHLIYSFSHTQLLCYALLKVILKDIVKPKHGDLICSYFLKTIMFWFCEELGPDVWKQKNIITCFMNCIKRLIYCVEYKICRHYFIPENNPFQDRFTDDQQDVLMLTLRLIYISPWSTIFQTSTFEKYRLDACELTASSLSCLIYPTSLINKMTGNVLNNFIRAITCFKSCSDPEVCKYIIALDSIRYIQAQKLYNIKEQSKSVYKQFDITFSCSRFGLFSDALSYWLLLASFMYQHKHFKECIDIVVYCLSKSTPDKIFLQVTNSLEEQTVFEKTKTVFGLLVTCKHLIIKMYILSILFIASRTCNVIK